MDLPKGYLARLACLGVISGEYYAFLVPLFKDGKFVWVLKISDKKVEYRCLRDIPAPSPIPIREVKTLETLPPIQALLTVPTAKKKA